MRPTARPGLVLAAGLLVVVGTAFLPAGLDGRAVPTASWIAWAAVLVVSATLLGAVGGSFVRGLRGLIWLLPPVVLLTLPALLFAAAGRRAGLAIALVLRALAAAGAAVTTMTVLGPSGLVAGLRALGVPARLVEIVHGTLVSLAAIVRQVAALLRARSARRPSRRPWSAVVVAPVETLRGFGRLVGAVLLRSLERAEALERARRARGGGEA